MSSPDWAFIRNMTPFTPYPYEGERVACPNCSGQSEAIANLDRKWKLLPTDVCTSCGLFFTNPMPREDELEDYYASTYRSTYKLVFTAVPDTYTEKRRAEADNRAGIIANLFDDARAAKRSLDLGCGLGTLVEALEKRGFDSYGFEPGELWSQHLKNDRIVRGNWRNVDFAAGSFDLVSIIHVLEHLRAPLSCLGKVHKLLKDDGLLWVEVPDMQAYGTKGRKRFHFAHVLGFSRDNLIDAAFRCGFVPVKEITKEQIKKRRNQVSVVFRKALPGDSIDIDLTGTANKNRREYGRFSYVTQALAGLVRPSGRHSSRPSRPS